MDTHSSATRGLLVGREFFFCPRCDSRLKNREYPTLFYKAFGRLFGSEVQFRWQCGDCGYREKGRTNWPLGLCFPGLVLAAASFVLQSEGFEETAPPEILNLIKQCLLGVGAFLFGLGFLIFVARLIRSNPVRKISCTICERYFKQSEAWASTDYCSVECAQAETEDELDEELDDDEAEDVEEEDIEDIEEVEEVEEDAEEIEDVEDVEDDDLEDSETANAKETKADQSAEAKEATEKTDEPVKAEDTKKSELEAEDVDIDSIDEDELEAASTAVDANDEVAEMVLFEDKTEYEMWDPNTIVSEATDDLDLDAVDDAEIEADPGAPEDLNEVEDAISLMDSQRKNNLSDRTAMWKVEDILSQTDDLDIMASTRMNKTSPNIESDRFNTNEIPAGITESGEESLEGSGDKTE